MSGFYSQEQARALLPDVRNYLDITWEDAALDGKLAGVAARGMIYLDAVAGGPQDYQAETLARQLLLDWCRYGMAGAISDFARNYQAEILMLRSQQEVAAYAPDDAGV